MKKLIKLLKNSLYVTGLCGLLSVGIFTHDQAKQKVESVSAISSSVPDLNLYTPYEVYNSTFYFDWSYLTYNSNTSNSNQSSVRNVNRNFGPHVGSINSQITYNNLRGTVWIGNDTFTEALSGAGADVDFYSYINFANTDYFTHFDRIIISGPKLQYQFAGTTQLVDAYDNGWDGASMNIVFCSNMVVDNNVSQLEWLVNHLKNNGNFYWFNDFGKYIEDYGELNSSYSQLVSDFNQLDLDYDSLEADYNGLSDDYESALDEIESLESDIDDLESEVDTLTSNLNNSVLYARQNTYIVDVKCELNYEFQMFINVDYQSDNDFYVKPSKIKVKSDIDVFDCTSSSEEHHYNVIDEFDFSNLINYYYNYTDLASLLFIEVDFDTWNLRLPYYQNNDYDYFELTNINTYIDDWLLTYKFDLTGVGSDSFQRGMVEYNNLLSGALSGNNMSYLDGYNNGYDEGYLYGQSEGYSLGYGLGYENGVSTDSTVASIFSGILQVGLVPINFFLAIFNFEILGINLSGFIRALFTVAITVIILRVVLGGKGGED